MSTKIKKSWEIKFFSPFSIRPTINRFDGRLSDWLKTHRRSLVIGSSVAGTKAICPTCGSSKNDKWKSCCINF